MQIVLPGALPDPREARELSSYLIKTAPTLVQWLAKSRSAELDADPIKAACTPYEQWLLRSRGFAPAEGQKLSAGLGPLWAAPATVAANQPVWLVELVHISPSRNGAALLKADDLSITPEQSVALFQSAQSLFEGTGFALSGMSPGRWRVEIPANFTPTCASPTLVSLSLVNDWWTQDVAGRPWRQLVNELQMLWFTHPVNQARQAQGLAPVNSLWLFGGATPGQLKSELQPGVSQIHTSLLGPAQAHDWNGWINALAELEVKVFQPWAQHRPAPRLVLTGARKIVELAPGSGWKRWLPGNRNEWRKWWSPQD